MSLFILIFAPLLAASDTAWISIVGWLGIALVVAELGLRTWAMFDR